MPGPENVIIIGSGPAGYTAALYASRANLGPLMFAGYDHGGQLMLTTDVENYPGFPEGVQGPAMMALFRKQAERFGTRIVDRNVDKVDFSRRPFKLWVEGTLHEAKAVIVSTGASAKWLGLPSEQRLRGKGVSACATCDGFFFKGKDVAVVGGGDSAMEEGLFLTKFANRVTLVHRRHELRASKIMQERALKNGKIDFLWDTIVEEVLGDNHVTALKLKNLKTQKTETKAFQGLFLAIGHEPNTAIFKGILDMDAKGYLACKEHTMTNVPGVFAAGDVTDPRYRQAVSAAGMGCMAAIDAERWLEEQAHTGGH